MEASPSPECTELSSYSPPAIDSEEEAEKVRAAMDEQIRTLYESILSVKLARNRLARISRLPSEILVAVFKNARKPVVPYLRSRRERDADDTPYLGNISWKEFIKLAHVCRGWREIVFDCPSLWTQLAFPIDLPPSPSREMALEARGYGILPHMMNLPFPFPVPEIFCDANRDKHVHILQVMMWRSKGLPLSVRVSNPYQFSIASEIDLLKPSSLVHIGELHVSLPLQTIYALLGTLRGHSAANLKSLFIRTTREQTDSAMLLSNPNHWIGFYTPDQIFQIQMPLLQNLTLKDCNFGWGSLLSCASPQLRSLKLFRISRPSRDHFFAFLSRAPNLETLYLETALPPESSSTSELTRTIELPKLSSCIIRYATLSQCLDFQQHVSYPPTTTRLHFLPVMAAGATTPENESSVAALLDSCGLTVQNPLRSHNNLLLYNNPTIVVWDTPYGSDWEPHPYMQPDDILNPQVIIDLSNLKFVTSQLPLLSLLSVQGVSMLALAPCAYSGDECLDFFKRHTEITHLYICSATAEPIFAALSASIDADRVWGWDLEASDFHKVVPCLPDLDILTLVAFGKDFIKSKYVPELAALVKCLDKRRQNGVHIRKLNLLECVRIDERVVDMLGENRAGEVYWDATSIFPPGDDPAEGESNAEEGHHHEIRKRRHNMDIWDGDWP